MKGERERESCSKENGRSITIKHMVLVYLTNYFNFIILPVI